MRKRQRIWIVSLAAFLLCSIIAISLTLESEPEFDGKPASYWATRVPAFEAHTGYGFDEARNVTNAFRAMGEASIPAVIANLRRYDSVWQRHYATVFPRLPKRIQDQLKPPLSISGINEVYLLRGSASALELSGKGIENRLPRLIADKSARVRRVASLLFRSFPKDEDRLHRLIALAIRDPDPWVRQNAVETTSPLKERAVPLLIEAIKIGDGTASGIQMKVRSSAAGNLGWHGIGSPEVIATLSELSEDTDDDTRISAELSLLKLERKPETAARLAQELEVIFRNLPSTNNLPIQLLPQIHKVEASAFKIIRALGEFGAEAKDAAPIIKRFYHKFMRRKNSFNLDYTSLKALEKIAPEVAEEAIKNEFMD